MDVARMYNYALSNNISIKKAQINTLSAHEDVLQSKAALLPSIDASTSQNIGYTPFQENGRASVANGYVENSIDKVYYNGNYGGEPQLDHLERKP